jgi:hypothetical protein
MLYIVQEVHSRLERITIQKGSATKNIDYSIWDWEYNNKKGTAQTTKLTNTAPQSQQQAETKQSSRTITEAYIQSVPTPIHIANKVL